VTSLSHVLDDVERLVQAVAEYEMSAGQALALLRRRGLTPDPVALDQAVDTLRTRDGLIGGQIDPLVVLEVQPRPGTNWRDHAVQKAEEELAWHLHTLAKTRLQAVS
jgi:hypothetical protein